MSNDKFYIIVSGFIGGIFFHSFFNFGFSFCFFILLISAVIFLFSQFVKNQEKTRRQILTIGVFLISFSLGLLRFGFSQTGTKSLFLNNLINQKTSFTAIITEEPDEREDSTKLVAKVSSAFNPKTSSEEKVTEAKVLITTKHYPKFNYGDEIKIFGELKKPENFSNDSDKEFDYISYLAKDGIFYQTFYPKIELISTDNGNIIKEKLFVLKNSFLKNLQAIIPEPHSSLLGGLILGTKQSLGKELQEDFRKAGLIHTVVLSGYNLTIVAEFVMLIFSFLPTLITSLLGATTIILFAVMTGASATIIRASIMALLIILARSTGRTNQITRSLFVAGILMLLHNPKILVFDPSFQLSFLATLGLILIPHRIEKYFKIIPTKFQIKETAISTIATQIFVLPFLLYTMGEFSIVSFPSNLLVVPFLPLTMFFGFLTGVISFVHQSLAIPLAYITYGFLNYELKVVDFFANLPFASVRIKFFSIIFLIATYLLIFIWISRLNGQKIKKL